MADLLCHRSFFSCKDNTLNVKTNNQQQHLVLYDIRDIVLLCRESTGALDYYKLVLNYEYIANRVRRATSFRW